MKLKNVFIVAIHSKTHEIENFGSNAPLANYGHTLCALRMQTKDILLVKHVCTDNVGGQDFCFSSEARLFKDIICISDV